MNCNQNPIGPEIPEITKLAVYCVLNPSLSSQTMYVGRTYSYQEVKNQSSVNTTVSDVHIDVKGPDGECNVLPMMPDFVAKETKETRLDTDFLSGMSNFNFIINERSIKSGSRYHMEVHSEEYGAITAETQIPGSFEITNINLEPNLTTESWIWDIYTEGNIRPPVLRVEWSKSESAAGYLVDITMVEYDIPIWLQHNKYLFYLPIHWPPTSEVVHIPYRERSTDIAINYEHSFQRGLLTRQNKIEIDRFDLRKMLEFIDNYHYRREHLKRFRVYVHALDQSLYNFLAFQYAEISKEQRIGQELQIPDISNIKNGTGVFGAAVTRVETSRLFEAIIQDYDEYKEGSFKSRNKNEFYANRRFYIRPDKPADINLQPNGGYTLNPGESVTLSWDRVEDYEYYVLVLKPKYLWFWPGNMAYIVTENQFDVSWDTFPYRDCEIEWYIKLLDPMWDNQLVENVVIALSAYKAPQVAGNYRFTGWSESSFFTISSGALVGFEDKQPKALSPINGTSVSSTATLSWSEVDGADAYLVYVNSGHEKYGLAVTTETAINPPFLAESDIVDGLCELLSFESGVQYSWQVCALRVKSGALGFAISKPVGNELPKIYTRYEHPTGIILQSQWSRSQSFIAQ